MGQGSEKLNTVEWNNLTSGLVGAVIGAIAGFLGSVLLNWLGARLNRRAAARAVLAEMWANADRALSAESTSAIALHEFWSGAWRTQLPWVAAFLRWPDLKILVSAYDSAERAYENARDVLAKLELESQIAEERLEQRRKKVCFWFLAVADEWLKAMRVLRRAAICRWRERREFDGDIQKIEQRLNSAKALHAEGKFA
jgi:hypothetical protein